MLSIFYDLETTDLNPVGQILNFAFVTVDESWEVISDFTGKIRLSRLQIPQPGALLANRTNIIAHQATAQYSEAEAMYRIRSYLQEIVDHETEPVIFAGYNSTRFDLPFLRTSMIRNGIEPYFTKGRLVYRDVLHVSQRLAASDPEFQETVGLGKSLSLQNTTRAHELLRGDQQHESKADVMLTIELAKLYAQHYGIDIRTWNQYEPAVNETIESLQIVNRIYPQYDANHHKNPEEATTPRSKMVLYESEFGQALWIDLDRFEKKEPIRSCVFWYNEKTSPFFVESTSKTSEDIELGFAACEAAQAADICLKTFFGPKNCDIEQFIYDVSINERRALYDAIWIKDPSTLKKMNSKNGSKVYLRWLAANKPLEDKIGDIFTNYALYRYGGKLKLNKYDFDEQYQEGVYSESFHRTYNEIIEEIDHKLDGLRNGIHDCSFTNDLRRAEDENILVALKEYIENSDITKFVGTQLKQIVRKKADV